MNSQFGSSIATAKRERLTRLGFINSDPMGFADGPNLYTFVHNDPLNEVDPTGTDGKNWKWGADNTITILPGATPGQVAKDVWGDANKWQQMFPDLNGDPTKLKPGTYPWVYSDGRQAPANTIPDQASHSNKPAASSESTKPAAERPAAAGGAHEVGNALGQTKITFYNVASESEHPGGKMVSAPGLSREYPDGFLRDVKMQGCGIDNDGRTIQLTWHKNQTTGRSEISGYKYVPAIKTASGATLTPGVSIAVDKSVIPLGTWVYIETIGWRRADDTGGRIKGNHIDVFEQVTHSEALKLGEKELNVWVAK